MHVRGVQVVSAAAIVEQEPSRLSHSGPHEPLFVWGQPEPSALQPASHSLGAGLPLEQHHGSVEHQAPLEQGDEGGHAHLVLAPPTCLPGEDQGHTLLPGVALQGEEAAMEVSVEGPQGGGCGGSTSAVVAHHAPARRARTRGHHARAAGRPALGSALDVLERALSPQQQACFAATPPPEQQRKQQKQPPLAAEHEAAAQPHPVAPCAPASASPSSQPSAAPAAHSAGSLMRQVVAARSVHALGHVWATHRPRMRIHHVAAVWKRLAQLALHSATPAAAAASHSPAARVAGDAPCAPPPGRLGGAALRLWGELVEHSCFYHPHVSLAEAAAVLDAHTALQQALDQDLAHPAPHTTSSGGGGGGGGTRGMPPAAQHRAARGRDAAAPTAAPAHRTLPPSLSVAARAEFVRSMLVACEPLLVAAAADQQQQQQRRQASRGGAVHPLHMPAGAEPHQAAGLQPYLSLVSACVRLGCLPPSDAWMRGWWSSTQPLLRSAAPRQLVALLWALGHLGSSSGAHPASLGAASDWQRRVSAVPGLHLLPPPPSAWLAQAYAASRLAMEEGSSATRQGRRRGAGGPPSGLTVPELCMLVHGTAKLHAWVGNPPGQQHHHGKHALSGWVRQQQQQQQDSAGAGAPSVGSSSRPSRSASPASSLSEDDDDAPEPPAGAYHPTSPSGAPHAATPAPHAPGPVLGAAARGPAGRVAQGGAPPPSWQAALWAACEQRVDALDAPAFALLLHALGMLGCRAPPSLLEDLWEGATSLLHDFSMQVRLAASRGTPRCCMSWGARHAIWASLTRCTLLCCLLCGRRSCLCCCAAPCTCRAPR